MNSRAVVGVLTAALVALVIGSTLYVPRAARDVRRAVPLNAQVVYRSERSDLAELGRLVAMPSPDARHPAFADLLQILGQSPLAVAAVPLSGRSGRDTWIGISDLGPRALALRWRLSLFPPEHITPARPYFAWSVWNVKHPDLPPWMRIRFAVAEGLLIVSVSDNSHDIYYLLDVLDGRRPSQADGEMKR